MTLPPPHHAFATDTLGIRGVGESVFSWRLAAGEVDSFAAGTHARTHIHTHTHERTHPRTNARTHERMHARTHALTHARVHTHTYAHTHTQQKSPVD